MREIEIKLKVKDLDALEKKLVESGCIFSEPIRQEDVIYSSAPNTGARFAEAHEGHVAIRIRKQGNKAEFTLKQQKSNEMDNIEHETEVKDPEAIHGILEVLGWKPQLEVKKIRKKGKLGNYEVCLDRVDRLGDYVEIEKMTDHDDNPEEVRKELFLAIKPFGLSEVDEETKGYDTLICKLDNKNQ